MWLNFFRQLQLRNIVHLLHETIIARLALMWHERIVVLVPTHLCAIMVCVSAASERDAL
jgi:hypothetical protein